MKYYIKYYFCCLITLSFLFVGWGRAEACVSPPPVCDADGPYVAECEGTTTDIQLDGTGSSGVSTFSWSSDCPNASFGGTSNSETPTLTVDTSSLGCPTECNVDLTVTDESGNSETCSSTVTIVDTTPPTINCNAPATIIPPDAPISFTAIVRDCTTPTVQITGFECFAFTKKGKRIDKSNSCDVYIGGISPATITILDTGGVGTHIKWHVLATDACGNTDVETCEVLVVNPGQGQGP